MYPARCAILSLIFLGISLSIYSFDKSAVVKRLIMGDNTGDLSRDDLVGTLSRSCDAQKWMQTVILLVFRNRKGVTYRTVMTKTKGASAPPKRSPEMLPKIVETLFPLPRDTRSWAPKPAKLMSPR